MTLRVAIPCYVLCPAKAGQALARIVETVRAATPAQIHAFHAPGQTLAVPAGVVAHALEPAVEPRSALPLGWLTAVGALAKLSPGNGVLVVSPANPKLTAARVALAVERLAAEELAGQHPAALVSVTASRDHPCQWQEFFEFTTGQAFVPVDAQADGQGREVAQALGLPGRAQVSAPFTMPANGPWPEGSATGRVFEWFPEEGALREVAAAAASPLPQLGQRVFLLLQDGARVRQAAFSDQELAALPLLRPAGRAAGCFLRQGALWRLGLAPELSSAGLYQTFALPEGKINGGAGWAADLRPLALSGQTLPVAGTGYLGAQALPPVSGAPLFLFNVLSAAQLPRADLALPYHSAAGGWELDQQTMTAINCATREPITGRQSFPDVLELEGSLLGLSASALGDPLAVLVAGRNVVPLVLEEEELGPQDQWPGGSADSSGPCPGAASGVSFCPDAAPGVAPDAAPGVAPGAAPEDTPGLAARRVDELLARLAELQADLALESADPEQPGPRHRQNLDAGRPNGPPPARLDRSMANLAKIRCAFVSLVLEQNVILRHIHDADETAMTLFPVHIYMTCQGRGLQRLPAKLEHGRLHPLMSALLEAWERSRNPGGQAEARTLEALAAMRGRAAELGLPPCWAAGLPLALARKGLLAPARDLLREDYARAPWLQDEHSRIGVECLRPLFRFDEYLFWLEQDAGPGRLSTGWLYYYCEALAACRQEERAQQAVAGAYARHPGLGNLYAVIAMLRHTVRDFQPAKGLPLYEKDAAEGRLSGSSIIWHVAAMASAGREEQARARVAQAYAEDRAVANGYASVGWHCHLLLRRDPEAAIALFEQDAALGRLQPAWRVYLAAAHLFKGDPEAAERHIAEVYADSPLHVGCLAQLGLVHWLLHGDIRAVLDYFARDLALGRLKSIDLQLLHYAVLSLAGQAGTGPGRRTLDGLPRTAMAWDLCVAKLGMLGFSPEAAAGLMTPSLRTALLAQPQAHEADGDDGAGNG